MLRQGWVSTSLAAARLGVHPVTIGRLVRANRISRARDTQQLGRTLFIRCSALADAYPPAAVKVFRLDDWSDLLAQADMEDAMKLKSAR